MSLELKQTKLNGLSPHPVPMQMINDLLTRLDGFSGMVLDEICRPIRSYVGRDRPETEDGYLWFWSLNFRTPTGSVRICIPWSQDWLHGDGSQMDRSAAIYADPGVPYTEVLGIARGFSLVLARRLCDC
jgi:hypothetical protein